MTPSAALWFHLTQGAVQAQISCTAWARSNLISKEITARGRESIWPCSLFIGSALYYWYFKIRSLLVPPVIKPKFRDASVISHSICLEEFAHRGEMLNLKWRAFWFLENNQNVDRKVPKRDSWASSESVLPLDAAFPACWALPKQRASQSVLLHTWPNESLMEYK